MRESIPIQPHLIEYRCDNCGNGFYRVSGRIYFNEDIAQVPHACNSCGHSRIFTEKYPTIRYSKVGMDYDLSSFTEQS